jgi:hypothetical protein
MGEGVGKVSYSLSKKPLLMSKPLGRARDPNLKGVLKPRTKRRKQILPPPAKQTDSAKIETLQNG